MRWFQHVFGVLQEAHKEWRNDGGARMGAALAFYSILSLAPLLVIAVELAVVLDDDPSSARETARRHTAVYVNLPNYTNNLRDLGFGDEDFVGGGSDRLVDAIVAWGDNDAISRRVAAMRDAGADHVCIQVIRPDDELPRAEWRYLAAAVVPT